MTTPNSPIPNSSKLLLCDYSHISAIAINGYNKCAGISLLDIVSESFTISYIASSFVYINRDSYKISGFKKIMYLHNTLFNLKNDCDGLVTALQPGQVNLHIRVKWVTFSPGHAGCRIKLWVTSGSLSRSPGLGQWVSGSSGSPDCDPVATLVGNDNNIAKM